MGTVLAGLADSQTHPRVPLKVWEQERAVMERDGWMALSTINSTKIGYTREPMVLTQNSPTSMR